MDRHCPNCRSPVLVDAERCSSCGADLRQGTQPIGSLGVPSSRRDAAPRVPIPSGQQRVCPHCGVQTLDQRTHCPHCDEPYGPEPLLVPIHVERAVWVGIETTFKCHSCGHVSPLNHLDVDGSVTCLHCGIEQRFDPNQWWGALAHAHAVADLSGPRAEGRFPNELVSIWKQNPFREVGLSLVRVPHEGSGRHHHTLQLSAAPGHPLCFRCRAPLSATRIEPPELDLACPACGELTSYVLPEGVRSKLPDLLAVVGREHEKGRRDVRLEREGAQGFVVRCPSCSAPVDVISYSTLVECKACHTTSRVNDKILRMLGFERPKTEMWWALFEGPSKLRARLERSERRAVARVKPRHQVPLLPDAPPGDELMRPVVPSRRPAPWLPLIVGSLAALTAVAVAAAVLHSAADSEAPVAQAPARASPVAAESSSRGAPGAVAPPAAVPIATSRAADPRSQSIAWSGRVRSARGTALEAGAPCNVEASVSDGDIVALEVVCQGKVLHARTAPLHGEATPGKRELFEFPRGQSAWRYGLEVVETAPGEGSTQLLLNTFTQAGVVSSERGAPLRVELSLAPESDPRSGAALYETPRNVAPTRRRLRAVEVSGPSPIAVGTTCDLETQFMMRSKHASECKTRLTCDGRTIYGHGEAGYGHCTVRDDGIASFRDDRASFRDSDPEVTLDLEKGELVLEDSPGGKPWVARLSTAD